MKKDNINILLVFMGTLFILVTIFVFLMLDFEKSTANYISLVFLTFSQIVCFIGIFMAIVSIVLILIFVSTQKINNSEQVTLEDRKIIQICEKKFMIYLPKQTINYLRMI